MTRKCYYLAVVLIVRAAATAWQRRFQPNAHTNHDQVAAVNFTDFALFDGVLKLLPNGNS